ncbi:hypothetical protein G7070_16460 [Propioniciclava coleopterorum]|uniref:Uncharacterized protein n=1 Tax=Propioniciclava coleopterorum TaxID=2714937 RepID=A0A6G7YAC8_9ACTN|nr:hypothetical protein [Propioniciclava coleopterorum]QIK73567.1 hypothetical protein G7070_16460 [Propioniciclava coleopterorum]
MRELTAAAQWLDGQVVVDWWANEMALWEDYSGRGPRYDAPEFPVLQTTGLVAGLECGLGWGLKPSQTTESFELRPISEVPEAQVIERRETSVNGIFRSRQLTELPVGRVRDVTVGFVHDIVTLDARIGGETLVSEIRCTVGGQPLVFLSGEAEEQQNDSLVFKRLDNAVLIFTDPTAVDTLPWSR